MRIEEKWKVIFIVVAICAVLTPIGLSLILREELEDAYTSVQEEEESLYWVAGSIAIYIIFGLVATYMIFSTLKHPPNITRWSKLWALLFLPILLVASVGSFTLFALGQVPETRGPYLSWTRDPKTTITVAWELKAKRDFTVQFGVNQMDLGSSIVPTVSEKRTSDGYYHYNATLTGLIPGQLYYYKIPGLLGTPTPFKTAPDSSSSKFKFILYGDSREADKTFGNEHIPLVERMLSQNSVGTLAFVINTGDLSREHTFTKGWNLHFFAIRNLAKSVPYMVTSGNHEWNTDSDSDQEEQPANLIQEFPMHDYPAETVGGINETSFAYAYGCAYFIFLGSPHVGKIGWDDPVNQWLNEQLAIGNSTYKFTFVSFHYPPFDRREENYNDDVDVIAFQAKLFHAGGVDAVFNGHNHVLAHQEIRWDPDGTNPGARNVTYILSGGGGAPTREPKYGNWANNYTHGFYGRTLFAKEVIHYYEIEIDGASGTATFSAINLDGKPVYDSFTLKAFK